jgi:hypothetical protein
MTVEHIQQARDWLSDCEWADLDADDIAQLTDVQIVTGIARHYDGGIEQFIKDGE